MTYKKITIEFEDGRVQEITDPLAYKVWTQEDIKTEIENRGFVFPDRVLKTVMDNFNHRWFRKAMEECTDSEWFTIESFVSEALEEGAKKDREEKLNSLRDDLDPIILSDYDDVPMENIDDESIVQSLFEEYSDDDIDDELLRTAISDLLRETQKDIDWYAQQIIDDSDKYADFDSEEELVDYLDDNNLLPVYFTIRRAVHKYWKEVRQ